MKKQFIAIIAVVFMIVNFCSAVYAEDSATDNWEIVTVGTVNTDSTKFYAKINTQYAYKGKNSMNIVYKASTKQENEYIELKNTLALNMATGKYMLTFYNLGNFADETQIIIGNSIYYKRDFQAEKVGNWTKYSMTFDYNAENGNNYFAMRVYNRTTSQAIDCISMIDTAGNEYISNGSFEGNSDVYDTTDYQAKYLRLEAYKNGSVLIWMNPSARELNDVKLYLMSADGDTLLSDELDITPGEIVRYEMMENEASQERQYKIVFSFETKPDMIYYYGNKPQIATSKNAGEWTIALRNNNDEDYSEELAYVDETESHTGTASLKISSTNAGKANCYAFIQRPINDMVEGKKYRISFWAKGCNVISAPQVHMAWVSFDGRGNQLEEESLKGTYSWTQITREYTVGTSKTLCFVVDHIMESFWIDDVTCFELNENGEEIGENLINDGSFEGVASTQVGNINSIFAEGKNNSINMSWKSIGDIAYYNIYEKVFGKYEYRGTISSSSKEVLLTGLANSKEYSFKLAPVNSDNYEGEECEVTAVTATPDYIVEEPVLKKYNQDGFATGVENLSEQGKYNICISARNNNIQTEMPVEVFVAVYDENDIMVGLYSAAKRILNESTDIISVDFDIEKPSCKAEIFVIDSRDSMEILCDNVVIN